MIFGITIHSDVMIVAVVTAIARSKTVVNGHGDVVNDRPR